MILLAGKAGGEIELLGGLFGITALVMLACYISFLDGGAYFQDHGHYRTGGDFALARHHSRCPWRVQFIIDGVTALIN